MDRLRTSLVGGTTLATLAWAAPALAQYGPAEDAVGAGAAAVFLFCGGIIVLIVLALFVLNVWMFVDALIRQEYEFPGQPGGNDKLIWVLLLGIGFIVGIGPIVALLYYFMVYRKVRRGSVAPPYGGYGGPPQAPGQPPTYGQPQGYRPPGPPPGSGYAPPPRDYAPPPPGPPAPPAPTGTGEEPFSPTVPPGPMNEPPVEEPPAEQPPVEEPPAGEPPAEGPRDRS